MEFKNGDTVVHVAPYSPTEYGVVVDDEPDEKGCIRVEWHRFGLVETERNSPHLIEGELSF